MRNNVRRITDGAIISALVGLLIVVDGGTGVLLDGFLFWILPIPILIYTVKYNVSSGIMVSVSITLLAFLLTLPHLAILIGFSNLIGLGYGYGVNKKLDTSKILIITFIISMIYYLISMILLAGFFGYDAISEIESIVSLFTSFFKGQDEKSIIDLLSWTNPFFKMMITFPVIFLPSVIALLQTIITHMISIILLSRLKLAEINAKPIFTIKISKKVGWGSLIILILTYVYLISVSTSLDNVIILVQFIVQCIFIVMGAILALTYVSIHRKPLLSLVIGLIIIGSPLLIMALGFVDVFTDVRFNLIRRAMNERES